MTAQDGTYQRLTVAEAAAELGVSRMTVRRMIQRGQLEAERVHRPQGSLYVVLLPVDGTDQGTPTAQVPRHRARHNGTDQGTPAGQLAAWSETFLMPLVAALERSQAVVREQAETIGTLRAENAALMASHAPQDANLRPDQLGKPPRMPRCRCWPACEPWRRGRSRWPCWRSSPWSGCWWSGDPHGSGVGAGRERGGAGGGRTVGAPGRSAPALTPRGRSP